jgi:hypothetical protein
MNSVMQYGKGTRFSLQSLFWLTDKYCMLSADCQCQSYKMRQKFYYGPVLSQMLSSVVVQKAGWCWPSLSIHLLLYTELFFKKYIIAI